MRSHTFSVAATVEPYDHNYRHIKWGTAYKSAGPTPEQKARALRAIELGLSGIDVDELDPKAPELDVQRAVYLRRVQNYVNRHKYALADKLGTIAGKIEALSEFIRRL